MSRKEPKSHRGKLPAEIEHRRTRVSIGTTALHHTSSYEHPETFAPYGFDNSFSLERFQQEFKVNIVEMNEEELIVDLIGIEAPIANAFRRILIAEIPTMAIELVEMEDNTGVMQDEVLSHRLGLIPIKVDARLFEDPPPLHPEDEDSEVINLTEKQSIMFNLNVEDKRDPKTIRGETDKSLSVLSKDLIWEPREGQESFLSESPQPVHKDIVITKLRPGQRIQLRAFCTKGIGKTHAKWSPVSTATYKIMPEIEIVPPISEEEAKRLVELCPGKVFDIEEIDSIKTAVVKRPRNCTMCRECIREVDPSDPDRGQVKLSRIKNHFIFDIESTGIYPSRTLFSEAINVLINKCTTLEKELQKLVTVVPDNS